jgi:hypothetical protein
MQILRNDEKKVPLAHYPVDKVDLWVDRVDLWVDRAERMHGQWILTQPTPPSGASME